MSIPDSAELQLPVVAQSAVSIAISRFATQAGHEAGDDSRVAFMSAVRLPHDLARTLITEGETIACRLVRGGVEIAAAELECEPMGAFLPYLAIELQLLSVEAERSDPPLGLFLKTLSDPASARPADFRIDFYSLVVDAGLIAHGWAANAGAGTSFFLLADCRLLVPDDQVAFNARPDVSADIHRKGGMEETRLHGVTIFEAIPGAPDNIQLIAKRADGIFRSAPVPLDPRQFARILNELHGPIPLPEQIRIASSPVFQKVVAGFTRTAEGTLRSFGPSRPAELTVILPFYRDDFFMLDHLASQRRVTVPAEFLFVSDDPELTQPMIAAIQSRGSDLVLPTRLLALSENVGFGAAVNYALRQVETDYAVIMNSDIYWSRFDPVAYAVGLLKAEPDVGVVGFRLYFEDGTVQHAGMELKPSSELGGLMVAVHPGKGLRPAAPVRGPVTHREVEAVTAACIVVRRGDFPDGLFDPGYVGGDFEDADLCMRLKRQGRRVMLVESDAIFHLERQSIRASAGHRFLTVMNCVRFNQTWF
ncbi:MAG: glycosyltransferase family 2 protein [Bauldia sp.]|nr:glycosyltransferase family 2 protein [Bauldia sp.]